jgi:transposase-like protein
MDDRKALMAAVNGTKNLNEAARRLGVSRRTLQNRMRAYGLARGRGGRPKRKLSYRKKRSPGWGMVMAAAAAGAVAVGVIKGGSGA